MGWLRLVGSLKLQVSLVNEPYQRDNILQKRPMILRSLLIVASSYPCPTWRRNNKYHTLGWLRSVESIKLQVPFAKYCLFYRVLLHKRPIIVLPHVGQKNTKLLYSIDYQYLYGYWSLNCSKCVSVLQCIPECCSVLRGFAVYYGVLQCGWWLCIVLNCVSC